MKLIKGKIYTLIDWYGQLYNEGKYIGLGEFRSAEVDCDVVLVFKLINKRTKTDYNYAGAKPICNINYNGDEITINLKNHYYGMTIEDLYPCNFSK